MLLTISTTHKPATDLGYLLYKHPAKVQQVELSNGLAHIFYSEASEERCTAALLLEIDPVGLVRSKSPSGEGFVLEQYVNDRPYVASSFMSAAIAKAYSSARNGTCRDKPELVDVVMPLEAKISVLPSRGGEALIRKLFEPLGYAVEVVRQPLDPRFPEWGESRYFTVTLRNKLRLRELLSHLYVLIPVLDNNKHYFVSQHEVKKLFEKGEGWLEQHPEREQITRRYLRNIASLTRQALDILMKDEKEEADDEEVVIPEAKQRLHDLRLSMVAEKLAETGAKTVIDMGCGEGKLIRLLMKQKQFEKILGMDVSWRSLEIATERLNLNELPPKQKERINLIQGSLTYRDKRLQGYEAAAIIEVIEHLDPVRLASFERVVFEQARPGTVILTTPNAEYNAKFETLSAGEFRHSDHRFEWTREEFQNWAARVAEQYHYGVEFFPVGPYDEQVGAPSQMAVFKH